jgi:GTP cyclohydrolase III
MANMALGKASVDSTKSGSTFAAKRTERIKVRVSAATIGASPAAYTSVNKIASALDKTRTKSSKQSRVRV